MSGFKMDDYVDVAERIREFSEKYPDGSLQSSVEFVNYEAEMPNGSQVVRVQAGGWLCTARAYRTADDERPGIGHAFEPVPGKTPYTKDSEAMNAETSAWGRAIVALGFATKKIASAQEVRARQNGDTPQPAESSDKQNVDAGGDPGDVVLTFGKHKDTPIRDVPRPYLEWWVGQEPPKTEQQKTQRAAAELYLMGATPGVAAEVLVGAGNPDDDIPF